MRKSWEKIQWRNNNAISRLPAESRDVVAISTDFHPQDKLTSHPPQGSQLSEGSVFLLESCARVLRFGGLLFVYGMPRDLATWGENLVLSGNHQWTMMFKYWIALEIDAAPRTEFLKPSHQGLLMFLKSKANSRSPSPFLLDTASVKTPHAFCAACGKNLKDWGGKKHLMNPRGAALSDVWHDLPRRPIGDGVLPDDVLNRISLLTNAEAVNRLHVVQKGHSIEIGNIGKPKVTICDEALNRNSWPELTSLETNRAYLGDCVAFLRKIKVLHPRGAFDLAFADPPYNLEKGYSAYGDALVERHYIEWCNAWLKGMVDALKPGGSLFVLNLPKWAIHHAAFLNQHLEFRHWIAWDALSDPRGKLMPAHYALLYYTKPDGSPVFNYSSTDACQKEGFALRPDSPKYCLRAACIKERKTRGDDEKVELSDIWFDIHRIKHKRDRDAHPCQLPDKLMERIIRLTTRPGGVVFDPFCGAGTTAIAAMKLGREFVVVDVDPNYVRITNEKLAAMKQNADLFGTFATSRVSVARPRAAGSKRDLELYLQNLARKLGRMPTEEDVGADLPEVLRQIDLTYPTRGAAFKRAKVVLDKST